MLQPSTFRRAVPPFTAASLLLAAGLATSTAAHAGVDPMIQTVWGQGGVHKNKTPKKDGETTYPGCTTLASAQILYYYQYTNSAQSEVGYTLEHAPLSGPDVTGGNYLFVDLPSHSYDFGAMANDLGGATQSQISATATFIYHVGVTLNAQFGGGEGSSATGKQIENAFRYQWGYNNIARRKMSVISKAAFGYSNAEWADLIRAELDFGRPVLYMAQQVEADAGHAFIIDGYRDDGKVHVNFGWGGYANGYYDANVLKDPSNRSWSRDAMIFLGLEPEEGFAAAMTPKNSIIDYAWAGAFSLISNASDTLTGYGLTIDEAALKANGPTNAVTFLQWEIDSRDGNRLEISADGMSTATITYGSWADRKSDRVYRNVTLPFVLDPTKDSLSAATGEYYTLAIAFDKKPSAAVAVVAKPTTKAASSGTSVAASAIVVGGNVWNGNGSLISLASGSKTGYGLTRDEARIHPGGTANPAVFFQWEIDGTDGRKLQLQAEGMSSASITYGVWNDRSKDVTHRVSLPYTLDPAADGLNAADGNYYVVKVAFDSKPSTSRSVEAIIVQ